MFPEKLFSIKAYGETHLIMRILGIKIKFAKWEYYKKRKENPYLKYKNENADITTLPPAQGQMRDIQLANLTILKEIDRICKENNIIY